MKNRKLTFKNPVIDAQVVESPFVADPFLGHTMPPGKDFIGEKDYEGIDSIVALAKKEGKKIILNIGDSSTSGWDSNIVTQNRIRKAQNQPLLPALFAYKTYSDYLREKLEGQYIVVNAGVPAHTSLQGSKRLFKLLQRFQKESIEIEYVTIYYGNNDSVWDHNRQDKEWVGKKWYHFFKRLFKKSTNNNSIITRVSPKDFIENIETMIKTCYKYSLKPILIEPITPIYWEPGTRVLNEKLERKNYAGAKEVYRLLDDALSIWSKAIEQKEYTPLKRLALEEAREKDYVVPRIKKPHLVALRRVAEKTGVPYIQIDLDRTEDDIRYFIDYCHPINDANVKIAENIFNLINHYEPLKASKTSHEDNKFSQGESEEKIEPDLELPTNHYVLY